MIDTLISQKALVMVVVVLVAVFLFMVAAIYAVVKAWTPMRRFFQFINALAGSDTEPGILERLKSVESKQDEQGTQISQIHHEVRPNTGGSIKDAVARIELRQETIKSKQELDVNKLDAHLEFAEQDHTNLQWVLDKIKHLIGK